MSEALAYWFKVALVILPWAALAALLRIDHHFGNAILWMIPILGSVRVLVGDIPEVRRELERKP